MRLWLTTNDGDWLIPEDMVRVESLDRRSLCHDKRWQWWPGPLRSRSVLRPRLSVCLSLQRENASSMLSAGHCATKCCWSVTSSGSCVCDAVGLASLSQSLSRGLDCGTRKGYITTTWLATRSAVNRCIADCLEKLTKTFLFDADT